MRNNQTINWLLEGDVSIQYQVYRDLLQSDDRHLTGRYQATVGGNVYFPARITMDIGDRDFISQNGHLLIIHYSIFEIYAYPERCQR